MVEDVSDVLGAVVGDFDTDVCFICREGCAESFLLTRRVPITTGAQEIADLIEGLPFASAVSQCFLLDAAAYLIESVPGELDDVKGVQHADCVLELAKRWRSCCPWKGSSVAIWIPERNCSLRSASQFLYTVPDLPGTRSNKRAVG